MKLIEEIKNVVYFGYNRFKDTVLITYKSSPNEIIDTNSIEYDDLIEILDYFVEDGNYAKKYDSLDEIDECNAYLNLNVLTEDMLGYFRITYLPDFSMSLYGDCFLFTKEQVDFVFKKFPFLRQNLLKVIKNRLDELEEEKNKLLNLSYYKLEDKDFLEMELL